MPAEKMHLGKFGSPQARFYLGGTESLRHAALQESLERGDKTRIAFPVGTQHSGLVPAWEIKFESGSVYEIEEAAAIGLIHELGLAIGEDGLSVQAIEGA